LKKIFSNYFLFALSVQFAISFLIGKFFSEATEEETEEDIEKELQRATGAGESTTNDIPEARSNPKWRPGASF